MPRHFVTEPGERPVAAPLARLQAGDGNRVTNRRHEVVGLNQVERHTLLLLDGSRTAADVAAALADLVEAGTLSAEESGRPVTDPTALRDGIARSVGGILDRLAGHALLVG
jgi:methyltransferase-like protein